ncbi:hypothetical protein EV715DRAFT_264319 [Schizophyllum commune]
MPFATTLYALVHTVLERVGIVAPPPASPTTDDASAPSSLVRKRSRTDTTQSEGDASDSEPESDGSDGSPRFRGKGTIGLVGGPGKKKTDKKKGKPICAAYNSKKGCNAQKCMEDHICTSCYSKHSVLGCDKKQQGARS